MTTVDGTGVAPTGYGSGSAGAVVYAGAGGAQASLAGAQGLVVVDTYY